jgi:hypothetical protein
MEEQPKHDCCKGCLKGKPGENVSCRAKMIVTAIDTTGKVPVKNDKINTL